MTGEFILTARYYISNYMLAEKHVLLRSFSESRLSNEPP